MPLISATLILKKANVYYYILISLSLHFKLLIPQQQIYFAVCEHIRVVYVFVYVFNFCLSLRTKIFKSRIFLCVFVGQIK